MSKLTTITVPTETGVSTLTGRVANIPLNIGRTDMPDAPTIKFFIEIREDGSVGNLTHYATGKIFYRRLNDLALSYRLTYGSYAKAPTARQLAEDAVFNVVRRLGVDAVLNALRDAPVLNK